MTAPLILPPRPELAPWIHHILLMPLRESCVSQLPAVLSPAILIFARGSGWQQPEHDASAPAPLPRAGLSGPRLRPAATRSAPDTCVISILFRPGMLAEALGPGLNELRGQTVPLDAAFPPAQVARMLARIDEDGQPARWIEHAQQWLVDNLRPRANAHRARLELGDPRLLFAPAAQLAGSLGIGQRQFERRMDRVYGTTLRDLRRLARFGLSLSDLLTGAGWRGRLAHLAQHYGYFDQPHMVREFVALTGHAPARLMQLAAGDDAGFWIYRFARRDFRSLFLTRQAAALEAAGLG